MHRRQLCGGPWKVHLLPPGEPKGTGQAPPRDKLTSGQKKIRWDSHLWASCTLLTGLDWGLPPLPRVPAMRLPLASRAQSSQAVAEWGTCRRQACFLAPGESFLAAPVSACCMCLLCH